MSTGMLIRRDIAESDMPPPAEPAEPLAEWLHYDPIERVIETLEAAGRAPEASLVRALIRDREGLEEDFLMRTLASVRWANDWDNQDDAAYDDL